MTNYLEPSPGLREWVVALRIAGTHEDIARELGELFDHVDGCNQELDIVERAMDGVYIPADGISMGDRAAELIGLLLATQDVFYDRQDFDLLTGDACPDDGRTMDGITRLKEWVAVYDRALAEGPKFKKDVRDALLQYGAIRPDADDARVLATFKALMG